jgi:hypothetical protein
VLGMVKTHINAEMINRNYDIPPLDINEIQTRDVYAVTPCEDKLYYAYQIPLMNSILYNYYAEVRFVEISTPIGNNSTLSPQILFDEYCKINKIPPAVVLQLVVLKYKEEPNKFYYLFWFIDTGIMNKELPLIREDK